MLQTLSMLCWGWRKIAILHPTSCHIKPHAMEAPPGILTLCVQHASATASCVDTDWILCGLRR